MKIEFKVKDSVQYIDLNTILHALLLSLSLVLCFNPTHHLSIEKFSRQIGMTVLADYDVSVLIRNFYIWIIAFSVLFVLFSIFFTSLREKTNSDSHKCVWKFLDDFSVVAFCGLCLSAISFFQNGRIIHGSGKYLLAICFFVYSACGAYIIFSLDRIVSPLFFHRLVISIFAFSCFAVYTVPSKFYSKSNFYIILFALLALALPALFLKRKIQNHDWLKAFLDFFFSGIAFLPMFVSFLIESMYVLNQHSIFISYIKYFFVGVFALLCICSFIYSVICKKTNKSYNLWNKAWVYPVLIAGIILCTNQPPLQGIFYPDIFESANFSILISDFLNFGKLPTVEHYGGHQLLHVISGIIYGLVSGDFFGAIVSPYSNWLFPTMCGVLFFLFLKNVTGYSTAFFTCLLISCESFYITYYAIGLLTCFFVVKFIKKAALNNAIFIWGTFVWTALSRLDLGFAVFGGLFFTFLIYCCLERDEIAFKTLLKAFFIVVSATLLIWLVLCFAKKINPINRLHEFLNISSSNPSWAYTTLGDCSKFGYFFIYLLLPFGVLGMFVYSLLSKKVCKNKNIVFYLFVFCVFGYFVSLPRVLVRHSFAEGAHVMGMILFAWLVFPLFMVLTTKNKKTFIPAISVFYILQYFIFFGNANPSISSYFERFSKVEKNVQVPSKEKIDRVILAEQSQEHYKPLIPVINLLLAEDESFIDFTDTTFIYSALGRECPVYVSQSPSMISGEFSQEQFIKQITTQKDKLPLALFPMSNYYLSQYVDGVPLVLRHYKIAEYLYRNYRPLCQAGDYAIWCDKKKLDAYRHCFFNEKLILEDEFLGIKIDYGYDHGLGFHEYSLNHLPYLWANKDVKEARKNSKIADLNKKNDVYLLPRLTEKERSSGNYIFLQGLQSDRDDIVFVEFGLDTDNSFIPKYSMPFTVRSGAHDYLLRASVDYYWYTDGVNAIKILPESEALSIKDMSLLQGD